MKIGDITTPSRGFDEEQKETGKYSLRKCWVKGESGKGGLFPVLPPLEIKVLILILREKSLAHRQKVGVHGTYQKLRIPCT